MTIIKKLAVMFFAFILLLSLPFPTHAEVTTYAPDNANKPDPLHSAKYLKDQVHAGNFTGAAIYEYPITLPKGRNGLTPQLSLTYNNQDEALDNIVGYHWSLDQFSIKRLNTHGVEKMYDRNDFLAVTPFESGKLLAMNLTDGQHGRYGQKVEGAFAKYEFLEDNSWRVTDKSGTRYKFGLTEATRQFDPDDPERTFRWMLEEIRDPNDNWIKYSYKKTNEQFYPKEIEYTGHGEEGGAFKIMFTLGGRSEIHRSYQAGFRVSTDMLVTAIEIQAGGKRRRKVELSYGGIDHLVRQTLQRIRETGYDANGKATVMPDTVLEYTPSDIRWEEDESWTSKIGGFFESCNTYCRPGGAVLYDENGDGLPEFHNYGFDRNWGPPPNLKEKIIDFNGDGLVDYITSVLKMIYSNPNYLVTDSYLTFNDGNTIEDSIPIAMGGWDAVDRPDNGASIADLNGDGLPDIIQSHGAEERAGGGSATCLNVDGNKCELTDFWHAMGTIVSDTQNAKQKERHAIVQDYNMDGLADFYRSEFRVGEDFYLNNGKNGWVRAGSNSYNTPILDSMTRRTADLNGDGIFDIVKSYREGSWTTHQTNIIEIYSSNQPKPGKINYKQYKDIFPFEFGILRDSFHIDNGIRIVDINGDRLPDVIQSQYLYKDGPGTWEENVTMTKKVFINKGSRPYFLKTIHTSQGGRIDLEYKTSPQYKKEDGSLANPKLPLVLDTLSKMTVEDGLGNISTTDYFYEDGHYYFNNPYDREFGGFRVITETDTLGYQTKTYFHQSENSVTDADRGEYEDHISKKGRPYRAEMYDDQGQLIQVTVNRWEKTDLGEGRFFPYLAQTLTKTITPETGTVKAVAQSFSYDDYGNRIESVDYGEVQASGEAGTFSDIGEDLVRTAQTFTKNEENHMLAYPVATQVFDQNDELQRQQQSYYDGLDLGEIEKGNQTKQENWLDINDSWVTALTDYDPYGMVIHQTNPRGYISAVVYGPEHLYPVSVINAKAQVTQMKADIATGQVLENTDPNGLKTENEYDGLGRLIKAEQSDPQNPGQMVTVKTIEYDDQSMPRSIRQDIDNDDSITVTSYQYVDGLGRIIEKKQEASDNQWVLTGTIFDERGNVKKNILARFSDSKDFDNLDINWTGNTFTYDALDRVLTAENPLGTTANRYEGWQTTVTDPNENVKNYLYDARGHLTEVNERNGEETYETRYVYDALGRLTQITDAQSNVRTFEYDSLGRRTFQSKLNNPDGWSYEYDENGNQVKRTDPKGQEIAWTYDELDRLLTEDASTEEGVEMSYLYDSGPNAIGRLSQVDGANYRHRLTYDLWGRATEDVKVVRGREFKFRYAYDRMGGVKSLTYPDGTVVQYRYNNAHLLDSVLSGPTTFVSEMEYSPLGQLSQMKMGNGVVTTNNYNEDQMYRLTEKKTLVAGIEPLQDYRYSYDAVGNLLILVDANNSQTAKIVNYQYDDLYRLTQADYTQTANNKDISRSYTYDAIGNMTYKSDVGDYIYETENPHAVVAAGDQSFGYDENGNMVARNEEALEYDYQNRLVRDIGKAEFSYGEGYDRVSKTNLESGKTKFYPDKYFEVIGNKEVKYIFAGKMRVAKIERIIVPPPTVNDPQIGQDDPSVTFTGTKESGLSLSVNGETLLALGDEIEWSYASDLMTGDNRFDFYTVDENGVESKKISKTVHYEVPAPTLDFTETESALTRVTLSGTKRPNTSIWINGEERVPLDDQSEWQAEVTLTQIQNQFSISAKDRLEQESDSLTQNITYTPLPPVVGDPVPPYRNPLTLSGSKQPDMGIWINGEEAVPIDGQASWSAPVTLRTGMNTIRVSARNEFGIESSEVQQTIPYDINGPSLYPLENPTTLAAITLAGTKPRFTGVWINGEEAVQLDAEEEWGVTLELLAEDNHFVISTKDEAGLESESIELNVRYTAPAPTLDALPSTVSSATYTLSGTKGAGTGIWINGEKVVPVSDLTSWLYSVTLTGGANSFELWAASSFGVQSEKQSFEITYIPSKTPLSGGSSGSSSGGSSGGGGYSNLNQALEIRLNQIQEQQKKLDEEEKTPEEIDLSSPDAIAELVIRSQSLRPSQVWKKFRPEAKPKTRVEFNNLQIAYKRDRTVLSWDAMPREVAKFRIYRSRHSYPHRLSDYAGELVSEIKASRSKNRFTDRGITDFEKYSYQILALNHNDQILKVSILLRADEVFLYEGGWQTVNFSDFTQVAFDKIYIPKHHYLEFRESENPKEIKMKAVDGFTDGSKIQVRFLSCETNEDGREICHRVDEKIVDVYVMKSAAARRRTQFTFNSINP